ncbi:MAG TPA: inositol monophosphatase family protein [Cyclobacteriaceae bacterium]|jgi:myo-inositol-1(or 4)-monophosphatase|nr:inositol monophosphatase [Cytophagales bacterium]HMR57141.1 inositol monophosphatase family protein [Cyclobacteriaceae bacterium]HRE67773.1 inositol monophosphatase family protein [Cyclobacteriaceae bacterium]HRF34533.1 inositol monophosphatase family protein [Cyclobacteriaceae bacterium]
MNLANLEKDTIDLCTEVSEFMRAELEGFDLSRIEQKGSSSNLVSYVDKESEKRLVNRLSKLLPGSGFLAEEGTDVKGSNEYTWIIDPLDGTTNYLHSLPVFAISIGLQRKDKTILGIVYDVSNKHCYHAIEHGGAYCNEKQIHVSAISTLEESLLATGFPYYHSEKKDDYLEIIKLFLEKTHGIRRLGSAAMDLAYVASGKLEGFFEYDLKPWDVAGGTFIVQQAGGIVTDFSGGNNFLFGGQLCAAGKIHQEMLTEIRKFWFK